MQVRQQRQHQYCTEYEGPLDSQPCVLVEVDSDVLLSCKR